jgi:hypothetical protein
MHGTAAVSVFEERTGETVAEQLKFLISFWKASSRNARSALPVVASSIS